ncbi:MAG: hypothetical protein WC374_01995 [Phycisphaerae bacterium]|jgi:Arc/MetJ-type ribon-helix-helix transcriptional regulator
MAVQEFGSTDEQNYVRSIHSQCKNLVAAGNFHQAAELINEALNLHPQQKELLILRQKLKRELISIKVKSLEQEALIMMQMGDEDKAQEKFRQIFQLDPTRTEYSDSTRVTRKEALDDYHKRVRVGSLVRAILGISLLIIAVISSVAAWKAWNNNSHLDNAENFIENENYYQALRELSQTGNFFYGKRKTQLNDRLDKIASEGWQLASEYEENEDYRQAVQILSQAKDASPEPDRFNNKIAELEDKHRQKEMELQQKQAAERAALNSATQAKTECETASRIASENDAESYAAQLWNDARRLSSDAETLFEKKEYDSAQFLWKQASSKYEEAKIKAIEFENLKNKALTAKQTCQNLCELAKGVAAESHAPELWQQGQAAENNAVEFFNSEDFEQAKQNWLDAANEYERACEFAKQSPMYNRAAIQLKKWKDLNVGMSAKDVFDLLGYPKMKLGGSQRHTWYYQHVPELINSGDGEVQLYEPQFGCVHFEPVSPDVILERMRQSYNELIEREHLSYARSDESIRSIHQNNLKNISKGKNGLTYKQENERYTKALNSNELRHEQALKKYKSKYDQQVQELVNGLPRDLNFIVAAWQVPDLSYASDLISKVEFGDDSDNDGNNSKKEKWHVPQRWRKLQLNASESSVTMLLGLPQNIKSTNTEKTFYYGDIEGYGLAVLTMTDDGPYRLTYWKEPFWPAVR